MCVYCGHDDPLALDVDHVAGRAHGPEVRVVCANCHRTRSAEQVDHPTCPQNADSHTRDVVWAQRFLLSWLEATRAAAPHLLRALTLVGLSPIAFAAITFRLIAAHIERKQPS
jgi:hypothetical protein